MSTDALPNNGMEIGNHDYEAIASTTTSPSTSTAPQKLLTKVVQNVKSEEHIVRRPFSPNSEKYIRKLDRLVKIYENMSEKNDRLRYHIVKVKEEINKLSHIKRHLCCRLSSLNDNYMDENLEIPDTNNRDANFEKLIGEIITSVEPLGLPASKKRKVEAKKVVLPKPKEVKENSEEPEAREAINRILNDAKSLMKQQQQEQEEMIKNGIPHPKKIARPPRPNDKPKITEMSQQFSTDCGSQSAPVIHGDQRPSSSHFISQTVILPVLNRTMSTPVCQNSSTNADQNNSNITNSSSLQPSPSQINSQHSYVKVSVNAPQETKTIINNSLPLPQTPGVYILSSGQQLIKQSSHAQAEIAAKDIKQKQEEKKSINPPLGSVTPQKPSLQPYVVTHHDLPKSVPVKSDTSRQQPFQSSSQPDGQKINSSQAPVYFRRLHPVEPQKAQQQHTVQSQNSQEPPHSIPQQQQPQIQIVAPSPKGPPLQAQITSQPLPNGSQPSFNSNPYSPLNRFRPNEGTSQHQSHSMQSVYGQRQQHDSTTINPQLLPHRQLNAQRLQMEQQLKERERLRKMDEGKEATTSHQSQQQCFPQHHQSHHYVDQHQQRPPLQQQQPPLVIQSSQKFQQIHAQPRLREALQNSGNDPQRHIQLVPASSISHSTGAPPQRFMAAKQSPLKSAVQSPHQQQQPHQSNQSQNNVYFIDSSRCIRLASRDAPNQLVGVQPYGVSGSQGVRYYVPQNVSTQAITVTSSPKKTQQSKMDDDRLLRASSIDHLLPDAPDNDSKNDDNIDWSVYEEPKPSKISPKKAPTPRKRGAAIKLDTNSDAMARISPILAKFQQEMAQSTVAQEQQHQQELTMAARNASKPPPARARKRQTKAEKEAAARLAAPQNHHLNVSTPSLPTSSSANNLNISPDATQDSFQRNESTTLISDASLNVQTPISSQ